MQKGGSVPLTREEVLKAVGIAQKKTEELRENVSKLTK